METFMINEKMYALGSKRSIIREIFEYCKTRAEEIGKENVFDFSIGNPSVEPPKEISETIVNLIQNENSVLLHGYTSAQGDAGVRGAIAEYTNERFGTNLTANNIYMTCGAAASLTISLKAIINPGDECILFAPFFTEYRVFVENAGGKVVVSAPMAKTFQIDTVDFESKITPNTKAVIINSPNNPSGVVYSEETIKAVTDLLKKKEAEYNHPIYLIADEPYRELVFGDVQVPYLMNYYNDTLVVTNYMGEEEIKEKSDTLCMHDYTLYGVCSDSEGGTYEDSVNHYLHCELVTDCTDKKLIAVSNAIKGKRPIWKFLKCLIFRGRTR
jgi:aspartate aminotransferase